MWALQTKGRPWAPGSVTTQLGPAREFHASRDEALVLFQLTGRVGVDELRM